MKRMTKAALAASFTVLFCMAALLPQAVRQANAAPEVPIPTAANSAVMRILVLGCDRAADLTDSIFVVSMNGEGRVGVLQIPRDTYADYTDRDYRKLNGALGTLGAKELTSRLSRALGVPINGYLVMDLDCLCRVVDSVGGVDVDIPEPMEYSDPAQGLHISFPAGKTHLDGKRAEEFVRFRSGYADADLGRLDAQKQFLKAFFTACRNIGFAEGLQLFSSVLPYVETDLPVHIGARLIGTAGKTDSEQMTMMTLSGTPLQGTSGAWYYAVNRAGGAESVNQTLFPQAPLSDTQFDPDGFFDRADHPDFHNAYLAPVAQQ